MRYVIDEASLPVLADCEDLNDALLTFANLVLTLLRTDENVGMTAGWSQIRIRQSSLGEFLLNVQTAEKDSARLAMITLDRCTAWDSDPTIDLGPDLLIDEMDWESYGVAYACWLAASGTVTACITVRGCHASGGHAVFHSDREDYIIFVVTDEDIPQVHRRRLVVEAQTEEEFFSIAQFAFPKLVFADGVTFRRLEGTYGGLRGVVVDHLDALCAFLDNYEQAQGNIRTVQARLRVPISIEGNTRSSERLMKQRDAVYRGKTYRCELHSKIEPHRNRIHFHPGDEHSGGRVVVGIFTAHLDT